MSNIRTILKIILNSGNLIIMIKLNSNEINQILEFLFSLNSIKLNNISENKLIKKIKMGLYEFFKRKVGQYEPETSNNELLNGEIVKYFENNQIKNNMFCQFLRFQLSHTSRI